MISYLAPGHPAALFEALAAHIGASITFETGRSGPDPALDPFAGETADLGWVCSTSLVELTTGRRPSVKEVGVAWVPDDPDADGRPVYFSDVVVRPDSADRSLDDLAGRVVGCNDPASLSGFHALRIELDHRGHVPSEFASLAMTGGHGNSIERLLAGEIDAAVVDSIVRTRWARERSDVATLRVVERLGPWPTQPVVIRVDATDDEVDAIRSALLTAADDPTIRRLLADAALTGLVRTDADHCDDVREAMRQLDDAVNR